MHVTTKVFSFFINKGFNFLPFQLYLTTGRQSVIAEKFTKKIFVQDSSANFFKSLK